MNENKILNKFIYAIVDDIIKRSIQITIEI